MPEPKTLLVGLSAWRLSHAPASPGQHSAVDGCTWAPSTECNFSVFFARDVNADDNDFTPIPLVPAASEPRATPAGAPFAAQAVAEIPLEKDPPIIIKVTATPTAKIKVRGFIGQGPNPRPDDIERDGFFEGSAFFVYQGGGFWRRHTRSEFEDEDMSAEHFAPPVSLSGTTSEPFVFALIAFFMARVRNRTRRALLVQRQREPLRQFVETPRTFAHLDDPPIGDRKVRMKTEKLELDSECRILEVAGFKTPGALGVCWPRSNDAQDGVDRDASPPRADPMESLVFFHASAGQNAAIYNTTVYPFGLEQIDHGFATYLNGADHPLRTAYPLGLPWNISVAGKQTVLILPLNRVAAPELTNLNDAEQAIELFEEIQVSFLRAAGHYFWTPRLGRMAIASFSAAINELHQFFSAMNKSPVLRSLHEEIYLFDIRHTNGPECSNYANGFKGWAGANPARRVRLYNDDPSPGHATFLGRGSLPASPFVLDSTDGRFTAGVVTDADWLRSAEGRDHFAFLPNPVLKKNFLASPAAVGDSVITLKAGSTVAAGASAVMTGEVYKVASVSGVQVTLDEPVRSAARVGAAFVVVPAPVPRTTLAAPVAAGEDTIQLSSALGLFEGANLAIDGKHAGIIDVLEGRNAELQEPLRRGFPAGTPVLCGETFVRSFLATAHAAGTDTLTLLETTEAGFAAGQEIMISFIEPARVKRVDGKTLVLEKPTTKDHLEGAFVGRVKERKLDFGTYHAMFVAVFLLDAMRKSGFK